jgi:hypothetical protein
MLIDRTDLIRGNRPGLRYGVAVADVDGDGAPEVVVAGFGEPNGVWKWDGTALADATPSALADPEGRAIGVACADVDGDGQEEVYVLNSDSFAGPKTQGDRLFARFGEHWLDLLAQPQNREGANRVAGRSVCALDRAGRGVYGFAVAAYGGPMRLYELGPGGRVEDVADEAGIDLAAGGRSLLALPLLSDRTDLFCGNEGGPNFLFRNLGDGTFEEVGGACGVADPRGHARGVAPVDADGGFALALGNWEGLHRLFRRRAGGGFEDAATPDFAIPSRIRGVVVADFDNDGVEEILLNCIGQPNRMFAWRDEALVPADVGDALEERMHGTGAAVADIDGDGLLELIVAHGESAREPLTLYKPIPNGNAWSRVVPLTPAGAPARGAVVSLRAGGRARRRAVCSGSGYLCQMEPVAHFGLGSATSIEAVEVRWPSGATAVVEGPPVGRVLTVPHPAA